MSVRNISRFISLAVLAALALPLFSWWAAGLLPGAISPLLSLGAALATRAVSIATLLGLPLLVAVIFRQRFFCRYICPAGLLIDGAGRVHACCRRARVAEDAESIEDSATLEKRARGRRVTVGQWLALITLGGALIGWPLFLWLDPMAMFSALLGAFHRPVTQGALVSASLLPSILLISLVWPRLWCPKLCPLGGLQDVVANARRSIASGAKRWEGAAAKCPAEIEGVIGGRPIPCKNHGREGLGTGRARRWVLAAIVGGVGGWLLRKAVPAQAKVLRPPGAAAEPAFTELCIRCGACIRACPVSILRPDLGIQGIAGLLAPVLVIGDRYCREDCCACTQVCPSGALGRITLAQKPSVRIGLPVFKSESCVRAPPEEGECSACKSICPYSAIEFKFDQKTYASLPQIDPAKCNGCGACEVACPALTKALVLAPARA